MIKLWSVQKKEVLDIIETNGVYYPEIEKSYYDCKDLYKFTLDCFNNVNKDIIPRNYNGLIFAFMGNIKNELVDFKNYEDFKNIINKNSPALQSLWKTFHENDCVILELSYKATIDNLIPVDINDFQFLMPPIFILPPFNSNSEKKIKDAMSIGKFVNSSLPTEIVQVHMPYISKANIKEVHPLFEMNFEMKKDILLGQNSLLPEDITKMIIDNFL